MQSYAASQDRFDLFSTHNVVALSLVTCASVAYLAHTVHTKQEQARRARVSAAAQAELVEGEAEPPCPACQQRHKRSGSSKEVVAPSPAPVPSKKNKRDRKGKGPAISVASASNTRNAAVQTEPLRIPPSPRPYPPSDVLDFVRLPQPGTSSSSIKTTDEDDDISDMGLPESASMSRHHSNKSIQAGSSAGPSRAPSVSRQSLSPDILSEGSTSGMRRRSSSSATSLSVQSFTTLSYDTGFTVSGRKSRKQKLKEKELLNRKQVVGMPKPVITERSTSVSRSGTIKSTDAYWTQDPAPRSASTGRPSSMISEADSVRSSESTSSGLPRPAAHHHLPAKPPDSNSIPNSRATSSERMDKRLSAEVPPMALLPDKRHSSSEVHPLSSSQGSLSASSAFTPPISPTPARAHSNGGVYMNGSMPPSPSPSMSQQRPPAYSASSFDAVAAQQAAYLLAQQQILLHQHHQQQQQQQHAPRSPIPGFFPMMPYGQHPNYAMQQNLGYGQHPGLTASARRSSSLSLASDAADGAGKHDVEKLREQVWRLRDKGKKADLVNERQKKELEIAKWQLQCADIERKQEDRQFQDAIGYLNDRAELAEKRVKELEGKLGIASETDSPEPSNGLQITPTLDAALTPIAERRPPVRRPSSPIALVGLERLDLTNITTAAAFMNTRLSSPGTLSPATGHIGGPYRTSSYASLPSPTSSNGTRRSRRGGRRYQGSKSPSPTPPDESDDDLEILLHSPALGPLHGEQVTLGLGLGIQSSPSSSETAETEPEDNDGEERGAQTITIPRELRIEPATPEAAVDSTSLLYSIAWLHRGARRSFARFYKLHCSLQSTTFLCSPSSTCREKNESGGGQVVRDAVTTAKELRRFETEQSCGSGGGGGGKSEKVASGLAIGFDHRKG